MPDGDRFLTIRSGPRTGRRKIGELYNGGRKNWAEITTESAVMDQPDACANNGPTRNLSGRSLGWVHRDWLHWLLP
ncbi:hypothetical protein PAF17_17710 [Paracoccus sp. Z330]|uniref:Uncharacterized protein n=1 Tax=Paracoccus onchidii TaxID=3017813 RepID=A0ABT4ZKR6_9RHOB|nr:hypothetical protein [Paracoccus onchidii]MDB6179326.1 hypothetical protein [Paracoccus onchidii]